MSMRRKALTTGIIFLGVGSVAGLGTLSAFSATTRNEANEITAGSVAI